MRWNEANLVHGEGDALGEPVRHALFQRYITNRIYEYDPETGRLLHDRVLILISKGNSKTEDMARLAIGEAGGPMAPLRSPRVTLSAASFAQANELLGAATLSIEKGPLGPRFQKGLHLLGDRILFPDARGGRITRIAAVGGTADGGKETCHIGDEIHEWKGDRKERVYVVKGKSLRKRRVPRGICARCRGELAAIAGSSRVRHRSAGVVDHEPLPISGSLQIGITTAGDDPTVVTDEPATLLGKLYRHGVRVATGEIEDPGFLFLCWEPSRDWNLEDPAQLRQAILEANPAAGGFLEIAGKVASYNDPTVPRHEFLRYDLGLWVPAPDSWFDLRVWQRRRHPKGLVQPPPGTPIALGFDGSKSRDSTAIEGCTLDGHSFTVRGWERDKHSPADWTVPRTEVDEEMELAFETWDVRLLYYDPPRWEREGEDWAKRWPGRVVAFDTAVYERFAPAVGHFHDGVMTGAITHDGNPDVARHIANAHTKETRWGLVIVKEHRDSPRRIDRAVARILAREAALAPPPKVDRTVRSWRS